MTEHRAASHAHSKMGAASAGSGRLGTIFMVDVMRLWSLFALFTFAPVYVLGAQATHAPTRRATPTRSSYTGTYRWKKSVDGSGCTLAVVQTSADRLSFELDCDRGAPSHNIGSAGGSVRLAHDTAVYRLTEYGLCELHFHFVPGGVTVLQVGTSVDCGFGHGVFASMNDSATLYRLASHRRP